MSDNTADLLVVTPHPGDIELGMGGMVAYYTNAGKKVIFVICTNGDKGTSIVDTKPRELAAVRKKEQIAAAGVLKVSEVIFLDHADLGLEATSGFGEEILKLVLKYRPGVVATCDPSLRYLSNPDHRVTGRAVLDAVWPFAMARNAFPELRENGVRAVHRVNEIILWQPAEPDYFFDITDTFEAKLAAFCCHKTQSGDPMLPEFAKRFRESAVIAAKGQNFKLGERFHRIEVPPIL